MCDHLERLRLRPLCTALLHSENIWFFSMIFPEEIVRYLCAILRNQWRLQQWRKKDRIGIFTGLGTICQIHRNGKEKSSLRFDSMYKVKGKSGLGDNELVECVYEDFGNTYGRRAHRPETKLDVYMRTPRTRSGTSLLREMG